MVFEQQEESVAAVIVDENLDVAMHLLNAEIGHQQKYAL